MGPTRELLLTLVIASLAVAVFPRAAGADDTQRVQPKSEVEVTSVRGSMPRDAILRAILVERPRFEGPLAALRERPAVLTVHIMIMPNGRGAHVTGVSIEPAGSNGPIVGMLRMLLLPAFVSMRFPSTSAGLTMADVTFSLPSVEPRPTPPRGAHRP